MAILKNGWLQESSQLQPKTLKVGSHLLVTSGTFDLVALCCHSEEDAGVHQAHTLLLEQQVPILSLQESLEVEFLDLRMKGESVTAQLELADMPTSFNLDYLHEWAMEHALSAAGGVVVKAAKLLGCSTKTLHNWLKARRKKEST